MNGHYTGGAGAGGARSESWAASKARGNQALWALAIAAAAFAVVHPFDQVIFDALSRFGESLKGDIRREWFAWQQYGQGLAIIVAALLIWTLDPARRARLLDLLLIVGLSQGAATAGKMLIGRPRPRPELMDAASFPGPWGLYPLQVDGSWKLLHGWERGAGPDLWSMPSSHTMFAWALSAFLAALYPRAAWIFAILAVMVGVGRVVFGAHWPTDVVIGAGVGYAIGAVVARQELGGSLVRRRLAGKARPPVSALS